MERSHFNLKSPISYAGPTKVDKYLKKEGKYKVSLRAIRKWLRGVYANSLQRPQRFKLKTRRDILQGFDSLWDDDLVDVSKVAEHNGGTKYLLVVVAVFSSHLWIEPLKNKLHESIIKALQNISRLGRIPEELRTDKGSEWKNKLVAAYLKQNNIHHYVIQNITKAYLSERVIRTIKGQMYRFITHNRNFHYMNSLD